MKKTIVKSIISETRAILVGVVLAILAGSNPNFEANSSKINVQAPPGSVIIVVMPTPIS